MWLELNAVLNERSQSQAANPRFMSTHDESTGNITAMTV